MNKPVELVAISFNEFTSRDWDGTPLYVQHQRIVGYVNANTSYPNLSGLFATPQARRSAGEITISWFSDQLGPDPKALNSLTGSEYEFHKRKLAEQLNEIDELIEKIEESGKDKEWASLLKMAIEFGGEEFVFTGNGQVTIAGWSMFPRNLDGPYLLDRVKPKEDPLISSADPPLETVPQATPYETTETPVDDENTGVSEPHDHVPQMETEAEKEEPEVAPPPPTEESPKKSWRWLWWLLLIPLILLLLLLLKNCEGDGSEYLPPQPGQPLPIPPENVGIGGDSTQYIVLDRLNIALSGENTDPKDFAKAFKALYPSEDYKVIYYDTLTNRIQIQVPKEERDEMKESLPGDMPEFQMIIWHEGMFKNESTPSDPDYSDVRKRWYFESIRAAGAWDLTYGKEEVVIAIVDNGFDLSHPELRNRAIKAYNVVEQNADVYNPGSVHGTHVAGLAIGEKDNGSGMLGVAPNCKFIPVHVADQYDNMSTTAVIDGILYAINQGADVINLSLGKAINPEFQLLPEGMQRVAIDQTFQEEEEFWEQIWDLAKANNVTVVMAAGNDNVLVGLDPMQRSDYPIKVNAVDPSEEKTVFSNYGEFSTLSAPGLHIYNSMPGNTYGYLDGTSMASPMVAGAAGLMKSLNGNLTADEIKSHLINTGKRLFASQTEIGNLIQLDAALANVDQPVTPTPMPLPVSPEEDEECADLQEQINRLYEEIARLEGQCPDLRTSPDTLKLPDVINDFGFLKGRWKSTTSLHNDSGDEVTIYFDFEMNGTGHITFVEPGNECSSPVSFNAVNRSLEVDQASRASCNIPTKWYYPYSFNCEPDAQGFADCAAKNKQLALNQFDFNLIKIY